MSLNSCDDIDVDDLKGGIRGGPIARPRTRVNGVDMTVHRNQSTHLRREALIN